MAQTCTPGNRLDLVTEKDFSFVEFWAPPPAQTIWTVAGDRCTWAPAG